MKEQVQSLIEALRAELQQYGEMLARLNDQQDLVVQRSADALLQSVADIQEQSAVIHTARDYRAVCQREVNEAVGLPAESNFAELLPLLPADFRPLIAALVQENNELLFRVHQRTRQNHVLLSRSVELMSRLISTLFPSAESTVYNVGGNVFTRTVHGRQLYEAIG